jgi:hypothetical protein
MREVLALEEAGLPPDSDSVLRAQGVPSHHEVPDSVVELVEEARELYRSLAEPRGMLSSVSRETFLDLYRGAGHNATESPLPAIVREASHLALFAATLGDPVCHRISSLFKGGNPALGYTLDAIASDRADFAADLLARHLLETLIRTGEVPGSTAVLPYSPGYCGWHVTGQRRLLHHLDPSPLGISLNESCLMTPIKSVSGVLVAGEPHAHAFENDFDFCLDCTTWECRSRIASIS